MKTDFELVADERSEEQGKGASRRLRRAGKVPAILYGGGKEPQRLVLNHLTLLNLLEKDAFYTSVLTLKVGSTVQRAVLKDVQRHPAKVQILHLDLQRVRDDEQVRMSIPVVLKGAAVAPGVKTQGGAVSQLLNETEVLCLPQNLPEVLELDISDMEVGQIRRLSDIPLPQGVEVVALTHGRDEAVVSIHHQRGEEEKAAEGDEKKDAKK